MEREEAALWVREDLDLVVDLRGLRVRVPLLAFGFGFRFMLILHVEVQDLEG
jgi:TRAP-type mannitol/chloroaromatic compound transport system substrate-binding protein